MNELREQCKSWLEEHFALYDPLAIDALESFACEQRIQALQKAKLYISQRVQDRNELLPCLTPAHQNRDSIRNGEMQIMEQWLDAEIQRMREEGEHVHSGKSRHQ